MNRPNADATAHPFAANHLGSAAAGKTSGLGADSEIEYARLAEIVIHALARHYPEQQRGSEEAYIDGKDKAQ